MTDQCPDQHDYRLYAEQISDGQAPYLILGCPYVELPSRCPGTDEEGCHTNLLGDDAPTATLGQLLALATAHETARGCLPVDARAELLDNMRALAALRAQWAARQRGHLYTRETSDGPSGRTADVQHSIYETVIRELDAVLAAFKRKGRLPPQSAP